MSSNFMFTATTAQHARLGLPVSASNRDVIRAAHKMLTPNGRSRSRREWRHFWLRTMIQRHQEAFILCAAVASGRV